MDRGDYVDAPISVVGDVALLGATRLAKAAKAAKALNAAEAAKELNRLGKINVAIQATEGTIAVARVGQAGYAALQGEDGRPAAYVGEAVLRILGVAYARRQLRHLECPPSSRQATVGTAPSKSLPAPNVSDSKLRNLVNDLYKGAKGPNPIGTGSTADAVRNELLTGLPTHGRFHSQKAQEYANALTKWLKNNPSASRHDRLVAQSLLGDLRAALGGN